MIRRSLAKFGGDWCKFEVPGARYLDTHGRTWTIRRSHPKFVGDWSKIEIPGTRYREPGSWVPRSRVPGAGIFIWRTWMLGRSHAMFGGDRCKIEVPGTRYRAPSTGTLIGETGS